MSGLRSPPHIHILFWCHKLKIPPTLLTSRLGAGILGREVMLSHSAPALTHPPSISYHSSFLTFYFAISLRQSNFCFSLSMCIYSVFLHCIYFSRHFIFTSFLLSSFSFCHASVSSAFNYRFPPPFSLSFSLSSPLWPGRGCCCCHQVSSLRYPVPLCFQRPLWTSSLVFV